MKQLRQTIFGAALILSGSIGIAAVITAAMKPKKKSR